MYPAKMRIVIRYSLAICALVIYLLAGKKIFSQEKTTTPTKCENVMRNEPKVTKTNSNIIYIGDDYLNVDKIVRFRKKSEKDSVWIEKAWADKDTAIFRNLKNGTKYFYEIRIGQDKDSCWSNVQWSYQDTLGPTVTIQMNVDYQNAKSFNIFFTADDNIGYPIERENPHTIACPISKAKLFYRADSESKFLASDSAEYDSIRITETNKYYKLLFSCPEELGDGYYEFFVQCSDWACPPNDTIPDGNKNLIPKDLDSLVLNPAWKQIWVDTKAPTSGIDSVNDVVSSDTKISLYFSAHDIANGPRKYKSGLRKVLLFCNYKIDWESDYQYTAFLLGSISLNGNVSLVDSLQIELKDGNGIYEFYTKAIDLAGNIQSDSSVTQVVIDTVKPVIEWLQVFTNSTDLDTLFEEWQNKDDSPFFLWDDPKSLSDDSFHVEIKREIDNYILFEDMVADTVLNLDLLGIHLGEGEHSFQLYAKSGSGLRSDTLTYKIKYDSTKPTGFAYISEYQNKKNENIQITIGYRVDDLKVQGSESGIDKVSLYWSNEESSKKADLYETHEYRCTESKEESTFVFINNNHGDDRILFTLEIRDCASNMLLKNVNSKIVRLISPNGGEHWSFSGNNLIKWTPDKLAHVSIDLVYQFGTEKIIEIAKNALLEGEYHWTSENLPPKLKELNNDSCKIRIRIKYDDFFDSEYVDESDSLFVIDNLKPDNVMLLEPMGGEQYYAGHEIKIRWSKAEDNYTEWEDMDIDLYLFRSESDSTLIASTTNDSINFIKKGDTLFHYTLPDTLDSQSCRIILIVSDRAGNSAWAESGSFSVKANRPNVKSIKFSSIHKFIHADKESLKIATVIFSNKVEPEKDWKSSITIQDEYRKVKLSKDAYEIDCKNNAIVDSIKIMTIKKFDPGKYKISVNNYHDLYNVSGEPDSSNFWVFAESELQNTLIRLGENNSRVIIEIPPNALFEDAVFQLTQPKTYLYPVYREGMPNYEIIEHSVWKIQAFDKDSTELDSLRELNKFINISIGMIGIMSQAEFKKLRMTKFDFDAMHWEILSKSYSQNDSVTYNNLKKISGVFALCKPIKSDIIETFPNPFNPLDDEHHCITIRFTLDRLENIDKVRIFDFYGNLVKTIDFDPAIGINQVEWDGKNEKGNYVANGGYVCYINRKLKAKIAVLKIK